MPQQAFSDDEMKQLAGDPLFTDDDFRRLNDADRVRYLKAKGNVALDPKFKIGPQLPPSAPPLDAAGNRISEPNMFGRVAKVPGTFESALALPASLAGMIPPLKPFSIPAAALLGGTGSVIDDLRDGQGLDIGSFIGGAGRQGALQLTGDLMAGPGAKLTMSAAMPGAEKRAIEAALETGAGTNIDKAFTAAKQAGNAVTDRVTRLPSVTNAPERLLEGSDRLISQTAGRSLKPADTALAMNDEVAQILAQNPDVLTALEVLEKKRGARTGYEALLSKEARNAPITPPSKIQGLVGDNAQRVLEQLDSAAGHGALEPSLADLNKRSGSLQELIQYLSQKGDKSVMEGLLPRFFLGSLLGALPEYAAGGDMSRYGPAGLAGGLALGFAPAGTALSIMRAGKALPPLARGTTAVIGVQRRKRQQEP